MLDEAIHILMQSRSGATQCFAAPDAWLWDCGRFMSAFSWGRPGNGAALPALTIYSTKGSWRDVMPFLFWFPFIILSAMLDIAAERGAVRGDTDPRE